MKIQMIPCLQDNYSYLIVDEENNTACVIDPSEADPVIEYLDNNKIKLDKALALHNEKTSTINEINLNTKNLSAELGIFLIER